MPPRTPKTPQHLVASIPTDLVQVTPADAHALLAEAYAFLAHHGAEAARRAAELPGSASWGTRFKRERVMLPQAGRPRLVTGAPEDHSLIEVVNQCATMERLLAALRWAASPASGLSALRVFCCHPTTSSSGGAGGSFDNDLVLGNDAGPWARFEVSDVASGRDGNRKEQKDLRSLGILEATAWPQGRMFLVVSAEFAEGLQSRVKAPCGYDRVHTEGTTVVLEAKPRAKPGIG